MWKHQRPARTRGEGMEMGWRSGWASRLDVGTSRLRTRTSVVAGAAALLLAAVCAGASWGASTPRGASWGSVGASRAGTSAVIVRAAPGTEPRAEAAVKRLGGRVGLRLAIINGFAAKVPAASVASLARLSFVVSVTPDARVQPQSVAYDAGSDLGSMYNTTLITGAQELWKRGYTGKGVGVALIDSGVVPVDGLTVSGKVVNGPDLSFESQSPSQRYLDSYGHGTHLAGIIAGRANAATAGAYSGDASHFLGMAPDARIVSVKVADAHGATD